MKQDIRMAAILEREGRLFLFRAGPDAPWQLPGGPLPPDHDDVDAEMDAILQRIGVNTPAIEEDFLQTHFVPIEDGQIVFNLYAATGWSGEPSVDAGAGAGWFGLEDLPAITMETHVRDAVLEAYGLRQAEDQDAKIMAALAGIPNGDGGSAPAAFPDRRAAGLDILRTLRGRDPLVTAAAMEEQQPEIAYDIIDFALGEVWANPALDRRTRSLLVIAMSAAQGHTGDALTTHIHGALNHGATPEQITETLRMVAVYAGFPAALGAWPQMEKVFERRGIPRPGQKR